jgi:hypothetical protein
MTSLDLVKMLLRTDAHLMVVALLTFDDCFDELGRLNKVALQWHLPPGYDIHRALETCKNALHQA